MESSDCLDDDVIAALAEGDTSARDALVHLETCSACRELVSLARVHRSGGAPAPARLAAGVLVGRHRIVRPLGAGGMGVVYLARDTDLDRDVAVKLLRGPRDTDALTRESRALAKLDHPNVVTAYEVGRHGDETYLVMEHVDAGTVRDWLAAAPRTAAQIVAVFADAARGLAAAHAAGLVHRDVKPDNILVGSDGRARVSDFGLAHIEGGGTERYLAPEVRRGAPADAKSDQWSLCASLAECLEGKPVPKHVRRVLAKGMSDDRYPSLDALATALEPRRKRWLVFAAVNLVALAAVVVIATRDSEPACSGALPAVWDAERRAAVRARVAPDVVAAIDAYATEWGRRQVAVCRAEGVPLTELRAACLASRRRSLAVVVEALATIDAATAPRAARAVAVLPALDECDAAEHLAARQPLPKQGREEIAEMTRQIDVARTRASLGEAKAAIASMLALAAQAEATGYYPVIADALRLAGREQLALRDAASVTTLRRALDAGRAGADDSAVADLAIDLYAAATLSGRPEAERDALAATARAAVARLRWREDAALRGIESYLAWAAGQDALARGALEAAERELRTAVTLGLAAFGPHDPRVPVLRNALAQVLKKRGKADEAAVSWALSLQASSRANPVNSVIADVGGLPVTSIDAAWELHDVGRDIEALAFVQRARTETASSTLRDMALDDLEATIAIARGDFARARELNARAVARLGPNPVLAHVIDFYTMRGDILAAEGDCAGATKWYRYVIDNAPQAQLHQLQQLAKLGLARCHAALSELDAAADLFDAELAAGIDFPRERVRTLRLAADVHWRLGHRERAYALATDALRELGRLPALVGEHVAVVRWIIARSA